MKTKIDILTSDIFNELKKTHKYKITRKTHNDLIRDFHEEIGKLLIKGKKAHLPQGYGYLYVKGIQTTRYIYDWKRSKQINFRVKKFNDHTNDIMYNIHWRKSNRVKYKNIWLFKANRKWKRALAQEIYTGKNNYFVSYG